MATTTPNFGLRKPTNADTVNVVTDISGNMDLLDAHAHSGTYVARFVVDAATYGTGLVNASAAIQAQITAAVAAGGGTVVLPKGNYRIDETIVPKSKVSIIGDGVGRTKLLPYGNVACIADKTSFSAAAPLSDATFADFQIDGINQSGAYSSDVKGIDIWHLKRVVFRDLYIVDTYASCLGIDFLQDCVVSRVIVERSGRGNDGTQSGGNGIGIGTGASAFERFVVSDSMAIDCKRFGIFVERQNNFANHTKGALIVGCTATGNQYGIGDCGVDGLIVSACLMASNTKSGFALHEGTYSGGSGVPHPGKKGLVTGCIMRDNTNHGVVLDMTAQASGGQYSFVGNRITNNVDNGIKLAAGSTTFAGLTIADNDIFGSGAIGILIEGAGATITDIDIVNNKFYANGQINASGYTQAIRLDRSITRCRIHGNRAWDSTASPKQTYGLQISAGVTITDGDISENDFRGNVTGPINNAGTIHSSTLIGRNPGYSSGDPDVLTTGEATIPRSLVNSSTMGMTSQLMRIAYFTAIKTETISQILVECGSTAAAATPSLIRIGVWTTDTTGALLSLVASTASDTTLLAGTSTAYTKAFSASFVKTAGQRYAVGLLVVSATTVPQITGASPLVLAGESALSPRLSAAASGQADLPATLAAGSLTNSTNRPFFILLP
jgi:hypothetical protein